MPSTPLPFGAVKKTWSLRHFSFRALPDPILERPWCELSFSLYVRGKNQLQYLPHSLASHKPSAPFSLFSLLPRHPQTCGPPWDSSLWLCSFSSSVTSELGDPCFSPGSLMRRKTSKGSPRTPNVLP